jgi:hypothetical protein
MLCQLDWTVRVSSVQGTGVVGYCRGSNRSACPWRRWVDRRWLAVVALFAVVVAVCCLLFVRCGSLPQEGNGGAVRGAR